MILAGIKTKTTLFTMRLSYSGRAAHRASITAGQEAFLEGHEYAFARFGGVLTDKIRYDNLNSAVTAVLFGRSRQENDRWIAFRSHYGFQAWYCQPGHEGSHEKGGVEGEGGRFRRNHCVPMPVVDSIEELNALLAAADDADDARRIGNRSTSVGQDFAVENMLLAPLPAEPFDTALTLTPRVDRYAQWGYPRLVDILTGWAMPGRRGCTHGCKAEELHAEVPCRGRASGDRYRAHDR